MSCLCLVRVSLLRCWVAMEGPCLCNSTNKETSKKKKQLSRKKPKRGSLFFSDKLSPTDRKNGGEEGEGVEKKREKFFTTRWVSVPRSW